MSITVTGAGGFIGHHLVKRLVDDGAWVRGVDLKRPEFERTTAHEFTVGDLRTEVVANNAAYSAEEFYALAADMGGMGFISTNYALTLRNNALINLNSIEAARIHNVSRYFFASSACVYPLHLQEQVNNIPLEENDVYPAYPEDAYGWEKLVTGERLAEYYYNDYGLKTHVARFHNVYGPLGTWRGGREKATAAICRKIAAVKIAGAIPEIPIWGDGEQTRSFMFIDDCIEGILKIARSPTVRKPINLGTSRLISINQLVTMVAKIAGVEPKVVHVDGPQGVRGRNSDNTMIRELFDWEPLFPLERGLEITYGWIEDQVRKTI